MLIIRVYEKTVYGNVNMYVENAEQAAQIARLTGKKTVSVSDLNALRALGFTVEIVKLPG